MVIRRLLLLPNHTALGGLAESAQPEVRVMGNYLLVDVQAGRALH